MANTVTDPGPLLGASAPHAGAELGCGTALHWIPGPTPAAFTGDALMTCLRRVRDPIYVVKSSQPGLLGLAAGGSTRLGADRSLAPPLPIAAMLAPATPECLGDKLFCAEHELRYAYIAGEMANGISTTRMVSAMAKNGMLGFYGAAGLDLSTIDGALTELRRELNGRGNWGVNLIHLPGHPDDEHKLVDLLLSHGVANVSASAFVHLTPAVVRCAAHGLHADGSGRVVRRVRIFAKVSRPEVATAFMSPPPRQMLDKLVARGLLTDTEAHLAARVPVATNVTVEADSGGHTDNRPLMAVLPTILALRDTLCRKYSYIDTIHVGAAGGLGTPNAIAAAFSLGAAYVLTGSINQLAVESGISPAAKELLAAADIADVAMAPSADMFELGVKVQVLRRGTLFAARAGQLYEVYRTYPGLDAIPTAVRTKLENQVLHASFDEIWAQTADFWSLRDPERLAHAHGDPKSQMALVFRWYLGMSSRWAIEGSPARRSDYQLWCGPAAGSFNRWIADSFLADAANRSVVQIARNLMNGAALITRANHARATGVQLPDKAFRYAPQPVDISA